MKGIERLESSIKLAKSGMRRMLKRRYNERRDGRDGIIKAPGFLWGKDKGKISGTTYKEHIVLIIAQYLCDIAGLKGWNESSNLCKTTHQVMPQTRRRSC
jgi:hypothetical protein